jgi:hypothetical protein
MNSATKTKIDDKVKDKNDANEFNLMDNDLVNSEIEDADDDLEEDKDEYQLDDIHL